MSFNDSKFQIYKGFEIQKQAHLDRYPAIKTLTKGHISQFLFEDYTALRETIINLLAESDIPTAKAILSMVKNQVKNKNIKFKDNKLLISLMLFFNKINICQTDTIHAYLQGYFCNCFYCYTSC